MSIAPWRKSLKLDRLFECDKTRRHTWHDRNARPRLFLETLEDRTVPSNVSSGVGLVPIGPQNNPNLFTGFNQASNGLVVGAPTAPGQSNPQNGTAAGNVTLLGNQVVPLLGAVTMNGLARGGVFGPLFGGSIINTFGTSNPLIPIWSPDAWGFGSGQNPNQPWMPAAYVNGLQNLNVNKNLSFADRGPLPTQTYRPYLIFHLNTGENPQATDEPDQLLQAGNSEDQQLLDQKDEPVLPMKLRRRDAEENRPPAAHRLEQTEQSPREEKARQNDEVQTEEMRQPAERRTPLRETPDDASWTEASSFQVQGEDSDHREEVSAEAALPAEQDSPLLTDLAFLTMPLESVGDFPAFLAAIVPEEWAA
jgi:hypothetical protein